MEDKFSFIVNGKTIVTTEDVNLLDFLRDDLGLISVKDGCKEGACGTCTILVDGKAMKSCIFTTKKVAGKEITTIEGFTEREKEVFAYAFTECGAVQCGFCIPGMVVAAKALFLRTLDPTSDEVKKALVGNICRCTGYVKIEQAIMLAAKLFRENTPVPHRECKGLIGTNVHRVDAEAKTLGIAKYAEDYTVEGMYYGSAVRSKYPRAKVLSIDTSEALKLEGVLGVLTADDVPGKNNIGHLEFISDWDGFIPVGGITRYIGDAVALVVAKDKKTLAEAKKLVKVEYEELPGLFTPEEAMAEGAPLIHSKPNNILVRELLKRGNSEEAIKNSKYVVTNTYYTPATEHAYLEPECALAIPTEDGVQLYTASQSIFDEQREVSRFLGIEKEKVRVIAAYVGGGFGGKEDDDSAIFNEIDTIGAKFNVGKGITKNVRLSLGTKLEYVEEGSDHSKFTAANGKYYWDSAKTNEAKGLDDKYYIWSLFPSITYDTRNHFWNPTAGEYARLQLEGGYASGYEGDMFGNITLELRKYHAGFFKKNTFAYRVVGGIMTDSTKEGQRFWVGGGSTLRGYDGGFYKGTKKLVGTIENRTQLNDILGFVVFFDAGRAWDYRGRDLSYQHNDSFANDIAMAAGVGLRINTPIGPLRFDFGWPIRNDDTSGMEFYFNMGQSF